MPEPPCAPLWDPWPRQRIEWPRFYRVAAPKSKRPLRFPPSGRYTEPVRTPVLTTLILLLFGSACGQRVAEVSEPPGRALAITWQGAPLAPFREDQYLLEFPPVENTAQELAFELALTNTGSAPVEIVDVSTSCGCIDTRLSARSVAPGQTVALHSTVGVAREPDRVDHSLMITTGEPDGGYFVKLLAPIEKPIAGVPTSITFTPDQPGPVEIVVVDQTDAFADARAHGEGLDVGIMPQDGDTHRLVVTWRDGAPQDAPELIIETRNGRQYRVPVKW